MPNYTTPCCGRIETVDEWRLDYARRWTGGRMRVMCGQPRTTPWWRPGDGCGRAFIVDLRVAGAAR